MSEWGQAQPVPAPDPVEQGDRTVTVGALLGFTAAALITIGLVQPLFTASTGFRNGQGQRTTITSWTFQTEPIGLPIAGVNQPMLNGLPLALAALALVAAAAGVLVARGRPDGGLGRASRLGAVIGATFLAATVCVVGVQLSFWVDAYRPSGTDPPGYSATSSVGPGFWSFVTGAAVAVVAAVVTWRSGREPQWVEPETPRLGIPVVVRRLPDEPPPDQDPP